MAVIQQLTTAADFWSQMVVPDCEEFRSDQANLRRALHSANSLFHMHEWVFHTHENTVRTTFTHFNKSGALVPVGDSTDFANALEHRHPDFGRIRGIANAGKHLKLEPRGIRPVPNAPRDAANTRIQTTAYGQGGFGQGPYGGGPRVMLEGADGNDMEFSAILESVFKMWEGLIAANNW
jgi:hypothetical protein